MNIVETSLSRSIKFWILLSFQIPSILCSIFILYNNLCFRVYRRSIPNHVITLMLIVGLFSVTIDLSLTMNYLREGIVKPQTKSFCLFWMYIDYTLYASGILLTAWASIERHILIFSIQFFRLTCQKICFHYLPIFVLLIYPFIFYGYTIFFYPCQLDELDFNKTLCGSPCFKRESRILNWYDMLMHSVLPCTLIVVFSLVLLIRVIKHKRLIQRQFFSWRRQRRLVRQLLSITGLYISMNVPLFIIILIQQCCTRTFARTEHALYLFYLYYFLVLLLPFVCLGSVGDLKKKFRQMICCSTRDHVRIQPIHRSNEMFPKCQQCPKA